MLPTLLPKSPMFPFRFPTTLGTPPFLKSNNMTSRTKRSLRAFTLNTTHTFHPHTTHPTTVQLFSIRKVTFGMLTWKLRSVSARSLSTVYLFNAFNSRQVTIILKSKGTSIPWKWVVI